MRLTIAASLPVLLLSGMALAGVDEKAAEARILAACQAEAGAEARRCDCYISEIKSRVPAETYGPMMALAAAAMSGDAALMQDFLSEAQLDPEATERMLAEMERAVALAAAICGG